MFSKKATEALKPLISPNTNVILSTSHRNRFTIREWKEIFERRGITIEKLSCLEPNENFEKKRKDELLDWFNANPVSDDFIILDDDKTLNALPGYLKQHLVLTSPLVGLTSLHKFKLLLERRFRLFGKSRLQIGDIEKIVGRV